MSSIAETLPLLVPSCVAMAVAAASRTSAQPCIAKEQPK